MFLAPAFLLGLLAIGVPLWLHRVTRANPTQQPFASLMFLEASETQRTAKHTIRYWLLLMLRIGLIAALAFAFAGPLTMERILPGRANDARLHAIVLDASYSMRAPRRWARAIAEAESILDQAAGADRVMLVRAAGGRIEVIQGPTPRSNLGAVRATLKALTPGLDRLDYGAAMAAAESWLGSPRPAATLHFISDLQASGAPLRFADLEPPADVQLVLHSIGEGAAGNAYIEHLELAPGDARTLQASIRNSDSEAAERTATLIVDGKELGRQTVHLGAHAGIPPSALTGGEGGGALDGAGAEQGLRPPPELSQGGRGGGVGIVKFPNIALSPGPHRIELRLDPRDALPEDDEHYAVIEHAEPRALLIARSEDADDAAYFEAALSALTAPRLSVDRRAANEIPAPESLAEYSLLVVTDASVLNDAAARRVLDYVAAGGAVLATLGDAREPAELPLLESWRIGEMRTQQARVSENDGAHPALREQGEWRRVRFFRQRAVTPGEDDKVLLAYDNGSPLLVERATGAGRMLVLTSPIDRAWNDLAIHPLFVHFVADAGRYLTGADAAPVSHVAGSAVMTGLTAAAGGQIFDPRGERVLSLAEARNAERLTPTLTGFYEVRGGAAARWLAVNVDARESDLSPLPPDYVQRWQALRIRETAARRAPAAEQTQQPRSLGPLLLWAAAAVLLVELLLANRSLSVRRE
jgi:hypothetical protein